MFRPDLSPFNKSTRLVAVGWLDAENSYTQGTVPDEFKTKLKELCLHPAVTIRGFIKCPFCQIVGKDEPVLFNGEKMPHGSGRIYVRGKSKKYVAHTLIFHYVTGHNYRPPDEFIEAVLHPRSWFLTLEFLSVVAFAIGCIGSVLTFFGYQRLGVVLGAPLLTVVIWIMVTAIAKYFRIK
jgi:hypothetical protein